MASLFLRMKYPKAFSDILDQPKTYFSLSLILKCHNRYSCSLHQVNPFKVKRILLSHAQLITSVEVPYTQITT